MSWTAAHSVDQPGLSTSSALNPFPSHPAHPQICSDINKPDGQYVLPPNREAIMRFMDTLPVSGSGTAVGKTHTLAVRGYSIGMKRAAQY